MVKSQRLYSRDVVSMKLWGGRFTGLTDNDVDVFNSSIKFDQKMYKADILGSIVHANMLGKQGIITQEEADSITAELDNIKNGEFTEEDVQNAKTYLISFGSKLRVRDGDEIEAGEAITEGSINPNEILEKVCTEFDFKGRENSQSKQYEIDNATTSIKQVEDYSKINTGFMMFGYLGVPARDLKNLIALEMLSVILGEGTSSRLYVNLVENMDEKETVYLVDEVKVDLSALVGTPSGDNKPGDTTIIETNPDGEIIESRPITLESVLKPIVVTDIPDDDLVDIYFASNNGHSMFIETKEIEEKIIERDIDVTQKTSVYEVAEKVENPVEIVIPDDNVPLATTTEVVEEQKVVAVQGPPTDGLGTETTHTHTVVTEEIKPTCLKDGKTITKCSVCEEIIEEKRNPSNY